MSWAHTIDVAQVNCLLDYYDLSLYTNTIFSPLYPRLIPTHLKDLKECKYLLIVKILGSYLNDDVRYIAL